MKNERYRKSFVGRTKNTLFQYFLKIVLPVVLLIVFYEEVAGKHSPRKPMYKQYINMPSLIGFLNFEVAKVV